MTVDRDNVRLREARLAAIDPASRFALKPTFNAVLTGEHRPYRPVLGIDKVLAEIERGRGTAYDTNIVDSCLRLFREKHYQLPS